MVRLRVREGVKQAKKRCIKDGIKREDGEKKKRGKMKGDRKKRLGRQNM